MEWRSPEGFPSPSPSSSCGPHHYASPIVQDALEHLASIELIQLYNEAKVELCRATRDLRSCGRHVQHVLISCGHASLCAECSQRCDICPVCRAPLPKNCSRIQLRLYNKCIEAGLISKKHEDKSQEDEHDEKHLMADVQRLYLLFDVALENNLVSLICNYLTDVCMDESAVSSDPVLAFLLDEVVVRDWCQHKFKYIISCLQEIYALGVDGMNEQSNSIQKFGLQLSGLSNVMEVLESSSLTADIPNLHQLSDSILKSKQHLEVMMWCIRHRYLENIRSRHPSYVSWASEVQDRKSAAVNQATPHFSGNVSEQDGSTLFIEDALSNLLSEPEYEIGEFNILCLQEDKNGPAAFLSTANDLSGYPFRNLRAAADILFLHGTSDMMIAKQATFLYYLFDRHWTMPELEWRHIIDDFAASFGIGKHPVLESLSFYLLDDHRDQALQAVERLLPEICGPETHAKVAEVLLQRQRPDIALMVLRCSGHDGFSCYANLKNEHMRLISLGEAVTALRVRVEFGLLTAAFMYLRMHCAKVKEEKTIYDSDFSSPNNSARKDHTWIHQVEVLVTELCSLCIQRNLVDRMIELPWNSDEERYLCKCLYENACKSLSGTSGSLLVVYYLQRHRYAEAYQVDCNLRELENKSGAEGALPRTQLMRQWRAGLVEKAIELLPEVQRLKAKTGKLDDLGFFPAMNDEMLSNNVSPNGEIGSSILQSLPSRESSVLQSNINSPPQTGKANNRSIVSSASKPVASEGNSLHHPPIFHGMTPTRRTPFILSKTVPYGKLQTSPCNGESVSIVSSNGDATREMRLKYGLRQELPDRKSTPVSKAASLCKPALENSTVDITWSSDERDSPAQSIKSGVWRWRSDE